MATPGPDASDDDVGTLYSALTLAVGLLAPYGGTLTEDGSHGADTVEAGTLAETTTLTITTSDADSSTLADMGANLTPNDSETGTLASGVTIAVAELSPYGGTLTESGATTVQVPKTDSDAVTLAEVGSLGNLPEDIGTLDDTDTNVAIDDFLADGTLTDAALITASTGNADAGTLSEATDLTSSISLFDTSDTDLGTLDEAVALTVLTIAADDGTLDDAGGFLFVGDEVHTLTEAEAIEVLTAAAEAGALDDTATVSISGGVISVSVASADAFALTDVGAAALATYAGKPLAQVVLATRLTAGVTIRRRTLATADVP